MSLPAHAGRIETIWYYTFRVICGLIFFFLIAPIVIIIPLSFNSVPFFTFTEEMLSLDPAGSTASGGPGRGWSHHFGDDRASGAPSVGGDHS